MRRLHPAILMFFVALALGAWVVMVQREYRTHQTIDALGKNLGAPTMTPNPFGTPEALTEAMALRARVGRQVAESVAPEIKFHSATLGDSQITFTDGPGGKLRVSASLPGDILVCIEPSPCLLLREVRALVAGKVGK